ncbi:MAG: hypothetical protein CYG60_08950 [Actinobacteria bacterium]|nr:MAG: hypothetical protein CYG60_08950 [Actinomycetota bacterium]
MVSFFLNAYRRTGGILAALSGAVLAYVIQLQTAFPSVATDVAFWGILGASVALMRLADREDSEPPEGTNIVGSRRSRQRSKSAGRAELLVAVAVVGLLAVIAVPTFLQQQKKIAESERARLNIELLLAVARYESFLRVSGNGPEAGVYTAANPIREPNGRPIVTPSDSLTITVEDMPEGEFTMEGKNESRGYFRVLLRQRHRLLRPSFVAFGATLRVIVMPLQCRASQNHHNSVARC